MNVNGVNVVNVMSILVINAGSREAKLGTRMSRKNAMRRGLAAEKMPCAGDWRRKNAMRRERFIGSSWDLRSHFAIHFEGRRSQEGGIFWDRQCCLNRTGIW